MPPDVPEEGVPVDVGAQALAEDAETMQRLAAMSSMEYDRCRQSEAERLRVRVGTLDAEVAKRREPEQSVSSGRALDFESPEPWPNPVDGAELLTELSAIFKRFVVLPGHAEKVLALWTVHTYALNAAESTPYLAVVSPEPRCGKSRLLDLLGALVNRPQRAGNVSPAALFRLIEVHEPTLLIDEADAGLNDNEDLRGLLNDGYRRGGAVLRTVGDEFEVRAFATFCPKAIAGIGRLPGTVQDRAITLSMRRKLAGERIDRLRLSRIKSQFESIRSRIVRWCSDQPGLRRAEPECPISLNDRAAEVWEPLLAIADAAGGGWPDWSRQAAQALSGGEAADSDSIRVKLLADIRAIFERRGINRISSAVLTEALGSMADRPWSEWRGKPITQNALARQLAHFSIAPNTIRIGDKTAKGYERDSFSDAFARYLPDQTVTPSQVNNHAGFSDFETVTRQSDVTDEKREKRRNHAGCDGVTVENPIYREVNL